MMMRIQTSLWLLLLFMCKCYLLTASNGIKLLQKRQTEQFSEKHDLCKQPSQRELHKAMSRQTAPKGKAKAGSYSHDETAETENACILSCCAKPLCNAAYFNEGICLNIECYTDEDCQPGEFSENLKGALLVNLRSVAKPSTSPTTKTMAKGEESPKMEPHICEIGLLDECYVNEVCVPKPGIEGRSMSGRCSCINGFKRNSLTQICEPNVINQVTNSPEASINTVQVNAVTTAQTEIPAKFATSAVTKAVEPQTLVVSAGEAKVLEYPDNSITLSAFALPEPTKGETYSYSWTLVKNPEDGNNGIMKGLNEKQLQLSGLVPGFYEFKVEVTGFNKVGSAYVNVTVKPQMRQNQAPVAVIKPETIVVNEGTGAILDGSGSTDDDAITEFLWEIASGPISDGFQLENNKGSLLTLKDLAPGEYTIRLTVTDSDGLKNSTIATVKVEKAADYPPIANAGDDVIVNLPKNSVTLHGNASTDDHGIASYEWQAKGDSLNADVFGVHKPVLHLTNLRKGTYRFQLEVTDTVGQKSQAEVAVFVKPSKNKAPKALVARNVTTVLPGVSVLLDGSLSTDDQMITSYLWEQVSGPSSAKLDNSDRPEANVANMVKGEYVFKLTVEDAEGLKESTSVKILVRDHANEAPKAVAGNDLVLTMPVKMLTLFGNQSSDDNDIVSYSWKKQNSSPAAGEIVGDSDKSMALMVVNLVAGQYTFTLTVTDEEMLSSSDDVIVTVVPNPDRLNLMEISLDAPIETFTEKNKNDFASRLGLLLPSESGADGKVVVVDLQQDYHSNKLVVVFLVQDYTSADVFTVRNGTKVKAQLKEKFSRDSDIISYKISQVDTVVCQNECSGHGYCNQYTKTCICEAFWMPNYVYEQLHGESNCEWSILYVVIIAFAIVLLLSLFIWFCVCCTRRCKTKKSSKRKHTYQLLEDIDEMEREEKSAKRNNISKGKGSIFLSETDLSSEEDTLFTNGRKSNGITQSLLKKPNDLVKANNLRNKRV